MLHASPLISLASLAHLLTPKPLSSILYPPKQDLQSHFPHAISSLHSHLLARCPLSAIPPFNHKPKPKTHPSFPIFMMKSPASKPLQIRTSTPSTRSSKMLRIARMSLSWPCVRVAARTSSLWRKTSKRSPRYKRILRSKSGVHPSKSSS